jgi:uncharacterized membrane protein YeaQ/YmgE (transglycosylase-associated protein family)
MSIIGLLILLLVAAIIGSIGAALAGRSYQGCLTNIALGFIGAIIGSWLSSELGIRDIFYFYRIPVIWSVVGSAIFVAIISLFGAGNGKRRS